MKTASSKIKILAFAASILIWLPIIFTILTGIPRSIFLKRFQIDYLMPAELAPAYLLGGAVLIFLAFRYHMLHKAILVVFIVSMIALVGSQLIAVATGLASGARDPSGWPMMLTIGGLILYSLFNIIEGVLAIRFIQQIFYKRTIPNIP